MLQLASAESQLVDSPTGPHPFEPVAHWLMLWLQQLRFSPRALTTNCSTNNKSKTVLALLTSWMNEWRKEIFIYRKSTTFINDKFYEMWANLPMNGLKRCIYVCFGPKKWRIGPLFTFFWIFALFKKICLRCFSIVYYSNYSALIF